MLVPAEKVAVADLAKVESGSLLLTVDYNPTLFWVVGRTVLLLTGGHEGHAFESPKPDTWIGLSIGPVDARVDLSSANIGEGETTWNLKADNGQLLVPGLVNPRGFNETTWFPIAEIPTVINRHLYFSRWAIGCASNDDDSVWLKLVSFAEGKVTTDLVPQAQKGAPTKAAK